MKPGSQKSSPSVSPSDKITQPPMPKISNLPRRGFLKGIAVAATTSLYSFTSLALSTRTTIAARASKRLAAASTPAPAPVTSALAGSSSTALKYSLESAPEVKFAGGGGTKKVLSPSNIAELKGVSVQSIRFNPGTLRELHWHPNAAELAYFAQGSAMVGIIGPSGRHDAFTVQSGDVSFVPTNYLHYIDSTSNDPLILISFLSNKTPGTIEFSQTMNLFPHQIIAASFGSDLHAFDTIPKLADDVFLAAKPTS